MLCSYVPQYKVVTLRNHLALMAAHFLRLQGLVSDENNFAITANITYMICALMTCCLAWIEWGYLILSVNISIDRESVGSFVRSAFDDQNIKTTMVFTGQPSETFKHAIKVIFHRVAIFSIKENPSANSLAWKSFAHSLHSPKLRKRCGKYHWDSNNKPTLRIITGRWMNMIFIEKRKWNF